MQTERTLYGLLDLNQKLARIFIWKTGIRERCTLIRNEASNVLKPDEAKGLDSIVKLILSAGADRNIIVHGLIHAAIPMPVGITDLSKLNIPMEQAKPEMFVRPPCWTIFMGEGRGKSYPVSTKAVEIVATNIHKIGVSLKAFNDRNGYKQISERNEFIETGWPKPL